MSIQKIDKKKDEFKHVPDTLDGEILLAYDANGILSCSEKVLQFVQMATPAQRKRMGWNFDGVDSYDCSAVALPDLEMYRSELLDMLSVLSNDMGKGNKLTGTTIAINNANSVTALMQLKHQIDDVIYDEGCHAEFIDKIKYKNYEATKL